MSPSSTRQRRDRPRTSDRDRVDRSRTRRADTDRPIRRLQEHLGNRNTERVLAEAERSQGDAGHERAVERITDLLASEAGKPLPATTRREMSARFGQDFGDVRVHGGPAAGRTAREIDAAAFTVGSDIVFGDEVNEGTLEGELLLTHELAHVVQNARVGEPSRLMSRRGDRAEADAERAAADATVGRRVTVAAAGGAVVSRGFLDWAEEKASSVGSAIGGAASSAWGTAKDVGSAIGGAASTAWDVTKGVGGEIARGVEEKGVLGLIYEGMKENAGYVRQGGEWLEGKIDWAQDEAAGFVHGLAGRAKGIPILEDVAAFGARGFDWGTQIGAGVLQGATSFGSGLLGMAANPVDTVRGLAKVAEHTSIPGIPNPIKMARGVYDLAAGNADIGEVADRVFNPVRSMRENAAFFGQMGQALIEPYRRSIGEDRDYGQAVGRAIFDIGSLLLGGGAGATAKGTGTGARIAGTTTRIATRSADDLARMGVQSADDLARMGVRSADEVAAGANWITHEGKRMRWTPSGWRDESGRFVKGPSSGASGGGASRSAARRELMERSVTDDKLPKHIRGWIRNQMRQKGSGYKKNPPGYEAGHAPDKPFATHGNQGGVRWELRADNNARAQVAKLQKRLAEDPSYTRADFLRDVRQLYRNRRNNPSSRPNLP